VAEDTARRSSEDARPFTSNLLGLIEAALGVGESVARSVAQATTDKPLAARENRPPLEEMVRLGVLSAGNVVSSVVGGAGMRARVPRDKTPATAATGTPGPTAEAGQSRPRVTAGSTLRIPLLVENSSTAATDDVLFAARSIDQLDAKQPSNAGTRPMTEAVSFTPPSLLIGPRDFEKLTVRIATSLDTAPGAYRAVIVGGDGWFSTEIHFDVVAPS
jgi:hypothetical protein